MPILPKPSLETMELLQNSDLQSVNIYLSEGEHFQTSKYPKFIKPLTQIVAHQKEKKVALRRKKSVTLSYAQKARFRMGCANEKFEKKTRANVLLLLQLYSTKWHIFGGTHTRRVTNIPVYQIKAWSLLISESNDAISKILCEIFYGPSNLCALYEQQLLTVCFLR